jgi:hypothetical protein
MASRKRGEEAMAPPKEGNEAMAPPKEGGGSDNTNTGEADHGIWANQLLCVTGA